MSGETTKRAGLRDVGGSFSPLRMFHGALFAVSSVPFVFRHPRLLAWSVVPMLVQVALFAGLLLLAWPLTAVIAHLGPEPGHWYSFVGGLLFVLTAVGVVLLCLVVSLMLGSVVCDPFYDVLSQETEALLLGRPASKRATLGKVLEGIVNEFLSLPWRLVMFALVAGPLWLLSLTGFMAVVTVPLTLAWTWMFVALSGMGRSLARHDVRRRTRFRIIFSNPGVALGFGGAGWLLSHLPLTSPFLVVGGTRLHLSLAAWDRLPSELPEADKALLRAGVQ